MRMKLFYIIIHGIYSDSSEHHNNRENLGKCMKYGNILNSWRKSFNTKIEQ